MGISFSFISLCNTRAILLAINGILDIIGLFLLEGIICTIFNIPFAKEICSKIKKFYENYIKQKGTREILLNEAKNYINIANIIRYLSLKNQLEKKVEII